MAMDEARRAALACARPLLKLDGQTSVAASQNSTSSRQMLPAGASSCAIVAGSGCGDWRGPLMVSSCGSMLLQVPRLSARPDCYWHLPFYGKVRQRDKFLPVMAGRWTCPPRRGGWRVRPPGIRLPIRLHWLSAPIQADVREVGARPQTTASGYAHGIAWAFSLRDVESR